MSLKDYSLFSQSAPNRKQSEVHQQVHYSTHTMQYYLVTKKRATDTLWASLKTLTKVKQPGAEWACMTAHGRSTGGQGWVKSTQGQRGRGRLYWGGSYCSLSQLERGWHRCLVIRTHPTGLLKCGDFITYKWGLDKIALYFFFFLL